MTAELLNLPDEEYFKLTGINWHSLERMSVSPEQYKWELLHPQSDTKALSFGRIIHLALLDSDNFFPRMRKTKANRGTKAFINDENLEENKDSIIVTELEYDIIYRVYEKCIANMHYEQFFKDAQIEQTVQWRDKKTGLLCKGRPDLFNNYVLVDIKTSRHVEDKKWWWDFKNMKYHCQFAFYHDALLDYDGLSRPCVCIKVETLPCYDVVFYPIPWEAIAEGRVHYSRLLQEFRDCMHANYWPGKCNELAEVNFDKWEIDDRYTITNKEIKMRR